MERWEVLADEAAVAAERGNPRAAADKFLLSYNVMPDKWNVNRWQVLISYTHAFKQQLVAATDDDLKNLREIADDSKVLILYRCEAAFTYAMQSALRNDREQAAEYHREVLRLADKMKEKEKRHKVAAPQLSADGSDYTGLKEVTMAELLVEVRKYAADSLELLTGPQKFVDGSSNPSDPSAWVQFDGTPIPEHYQFQGTRMCIGPNALRLTPDMVNHLFSVGGDKCDCCGKTAEEKKLKWLTRCSSCKKAWYCGKECQTKQWKAGHDKYCRKPGEFKKGDYVRLHGLQSRTDLNGMVVTILGPDTNKEGRWEVRIPENGKSVSIATAKMIQLRPFK